MELWIRNQKKNLLTKTNYVEYSLWDEQHRIYCNGEVVAIYDSKERALEVIDEIQNILQPKVIWREPKTDIKYDESFIQTLSNDMVIQTTQQVEYDLKQAGQIVYEMPKE